MCVGEAWYRGVVVVSVCVFGGGWYRELWCRVCVHMVGAGVMVVNVCVFGGTLFRGLWW